VRFVHLIPHSSVDCVRREVLADSILALNRLIASNSGIRRESASRRLSAIPTSYERLPLMQQAGESSRPATTSRCGSGPRRERRFRWAVFSASSRDQAKLLLILTSSQTLESGHTSLVFDVQFDAGRIVRSVAFVVWMSTESLEM
jgi:hypothetical protein